jgi:hypothetical protein
MCPNVIGLDDGGLLEEEEGLVVQPLRLQGVPHVVVQLCILKPNPTAHVGNRINRNRTNNCYGTAYIFNSCDLNHDI